MAGKMSDMHRLVKRLAAPVGMSGIFSGIGAPPLTPCLLATTSGALLALVDDEC